MYQSDTNAQAIIKAQKKESANTNTQRERETTPWACAATIENTTRKSKKKKEEEEESSWKQDKPL